MDISQLHRSQQADTMTRILLLLFATTIVWGSARSETKKSNTTETDLEARERFRRLIPYMTYYMTRGTSPILYQTGQQYRPVVALAGGGSSNRIETGGFIPIPAPVVTQQYDPSPLTRMITQNYLTIAEQTNAPIRNRFNGYQTYKVVPAKQRYVLPVPQQQSYTPQPSRGFVPIRPSPPDTVTITQSQEIPVKEAVVQPVYQEPVYQKPQAFVSEPLYSVSPTPEPVSNYHPQQDVTYDEITQVEPTSEEDTEKNFNILEGYQLSKALPERITSENLDASIKTLSKILRILQRANALPHSAKQLVKEFPKDDGSFAAKAQKLAKKIPPLQQEGSTPGRAGVDYPAYTEIPQTHFSCKQQRYKGFFGDPETGCQVWHYCDLNGGQASFLCPNGTIFSQVALTCDWWFNVKCASTAQLYVLNERLYKYILPQKPSWPEDYSGPLVDSYLKLKYDEIERNRTEEARKKHKDHVKEEEENSHEEEEEEEEVEELDEVPSN